MSNDPDTRQDDASQDDASQDDASQDDASQDDQSPNWLEWAVGIVGFLIVAGTIGFVSYKIISGVGAPPELRITLATPVDHGTQMLVPVEVENVGGGVAVDVTVEVCARPDACAQLAFDYVPHASLRTGMVGFAKPLDQALSTRIVSYREP